MTWTNSTPSLNLCLGTRLSNYFGSTNSRNVVRRIVFGLALAILAFCFGSTSARAQNQGEINGTVTDPTGAVIPQATVTIVNGGTGETHTAQTNSAGFFDFTALGPGQYNLSAQRSGFANYQKNDITLNITQVLREDIPMKAGSRSETVTVEAAALQVQTQTNEMSSLITGQQMVQLATNGRNMVSLATLGTGVSTNAPSFNGVTAQGSNFNISFNGMRPDHNNWLIDGGEVYDRGSGGKLDVMPAPDMLDEFQVLSSNYTPDYGIASGGTVTMVLKQGTKSFHGALWEFVRNDAFDANNYFTKQNHQRNPELRLNIFGGTIGGPLFIPHLFNTNRDKTFFFWGEEWRRYIAGAQPSTQNTMPASDFPTAGQPFTYTPLQGQSAVTCPVAGPSNGTSSYICVPQTSDAAKLALYSADGLTPGAPFPNNTIPANLLDSNALLMLSTGAIPKPNAGLHTPQDQYVASPKQPTYVREDVVRADHIFSDKFHLLGSWIHDSMSQTIIPTMWSGDSYSTVGDVFDNPSWAAVIKLTQTLSPTLLNETALNVNGNTIDVSPYGIYQQPSGWTATSFFPGNNLLNRLPQVGFSGGPLNTTWSVIYWPWHNSFLDYQFRDDLSKIVGKHALKFGFSYMRMDKNQQLQSDTEGDYGFNGSNYSHNSYANFLLGFASSYAQLQNQRTGHYINNTYSFYVNDDWRATQRLVLNLGFRWDFLPHVYDKFNQLGNFNPAAYSAANAQQPNPSTGTLNSTGPGFVTVNGVPYYLNGIQVAGQNGVSPGFVGNDYKTFQPRIGFAFDMFGNGKDVLRGGAGIFYERVQGNDVYNINTTPPFSYQASVSNVYFTTPTTSADTGQPASTTSRGTAGLTNLNTHYPNPGTVQYSLGIQHEIRPSMIATLGYVGTVMWSQNDLREINDLNFNTPVAIRQAVAGNTVPCPAAGVPASDCIPGSSGLVVSKSASVYRPYLGFGNIRQEENQVNANYNSLQAMFRIERKHGLTLQLAYTYSHEIDVMSADLTTANQQGSGGTLSNPYDQSYDYGSGNFDRRHIFGANYVYEVPFYLHASGWQRQVMGGWQIAGVTVAEAGTPLNVYYNGPDMLGLGGNTTNRPNIIGSISHPRTQLSWINNANTTQTGGLLTKGSFQQPLATWLGGTTGYGNGRKDAIVGPGLFNWNVAVYKDFPFTSHEGPRLQLRAESYNTFNHREFNGVDTGLSDGNFGQVTSTFDARKLQFGAKFLF